VHLGQKERERTNTVVRRWYYTVAWRQLRATVLDDNPLCVSCQSHGVVAIATEIDHIAPHRNDPGRFWNRANLQGLCASCHGRKTGRGE
jgi:5-methylcytosine-specific restriction enzyme A